MRRSLAWMSLALLFVIACGSPASEEPAGADGGAAAGDDPGGASGDAPGGAADAGAPPATTKPTFGEPIVLAPDQLEQWVWIPMPAMQCADGTAGGFAVNFTKKSRDLLVFLQGGGICYNALTCAAGGAPKSVGNDPLNTALDGSIKNHVGIFDRGDATNPLRDSSFVVIPHCTGDHHTGNRIATYGSATFHHVGYTNITRMLERVVPTFSDASRVVLAGFGAGGVGITANYHQLASAFESVGRPAPYLVIDAGPFMRPPFLATSAQATLRENWGLDGTIGTFCPSCFTTGFHDLYRVNGALHPGLRSSLLCSYDDSVVRLLYSVLNGGQVAMHEGLVDLADWGEATLGSNGASRHRVFHYGGTRHGALQVDALSKTAGLVDFLAGQLGTGDWPSVRP